MKIHLAPRILLQKQTDQISLVDVTIPELGIKLRGGEDLALRKPYPNKNHLVACRKTGKKAINGILIDVPGLRIDRFTMIARWSINAEAILTHRVQYEILDTDHDAVSEYMLLWYSSQYCGRVLASRWASDYAEYSPSEAQPRMTTIGSDGRKGNIIDTINGDGLVIERSEVFRLHSLEVDRLLSREGFGARLPDQEHAFLATGHSLAA